MPQPLPIGFVRITLYVICVVFALSGIAILVMASLIFHDVKSYGAVGEFLEARFNGPLITLLVVGSLILVVTVLGVCSTWREHQLASLTFAVLLFVITICEVDVATVCFLRSDNMDSSNRAIMVDSFATYPFNKEVSNSYNAMQYDLKCCGVIGPKDYIIIFQNMTVPASCCKDYDGKMCKQTFVDHNVHQMGCYEALTHFVNRSGIVLGSVSMSFSLIQIAGIIFSVNLITALQNEQEIMDISLHPNPRLNERIIVPSNNRNTETTATDGALAPLQMEA